MRQQNELNTKIEAIITALNPKGLHEASNLDSLDFEAINIFSVIENIDRLKSDLILNDDYVSKSLFAQLERLSPIIEVIKTYKMDKSPNDVAELKAAVEKIEQILQIEFKFNFLNEDNVKICTSLREVEQFEQILAFIQLPSLDEQKIEKDAEITLIISNLHTIMENVKKEYISKIVELLKEVEIVFKNLELLKILENLKNPSGNNSKDYLLELKNYIIDRAETIKIPEEIMKDTSILIKNQEKAKLEITLHKIKEIRWENDEEKANAITSLIRTLEQDLNLM